MRTFADRDWLEVKNQRHGRKFMQDLPQIREE